jgi:glycosyltransferase involved in cell wall biosynthesis
VKRLAYIMGTFPALTETFVLGEIEALVTAGVPVELFSLRRPRTLHDQSYGQDLAARTHYGPGLWSRDLWATNLRVLRRFPGRYLRTLASIAGRTALNPVYCLKSLGLFPVAVVFAEQMERDGVDHVHAHWANYPATAAYVAARVLGCPFSITAHVYDATLIRSLMREKLRRARFVVTCNRWSAERLARLAPEARERIAVNYHGVTLERFVAGSREPGPPSEALSIMSCGGLYPRKGFPVLLEACRILRDRGWKFRCTIIGEGPQRRELDRFIAKHQLDDCVALLGARPHREVLRHYRDADLFVLACLTDYLGWREILSDPVLLLEVGPAIPFRPITDGIPNVLAEAMAMQVPVVSTTVAGIPELVEHGHSGLLVPEGNPVALAAAIESLLENPERRRELGRHGRIAVNERFDRTKNIQDLIRLLDPATTDRSGRGEGLVPCARS